VTGISRAPVTVTSCSADVVISEVTGSAVAMPLISPAYRGPLVIFAVGVGFSAVGAVPVAITFSLGARSSATIIGMGFIGFGFLLMLPGVFWCLMVRTHSFKTWRRRLWRRRTNDDDDVGQATDDDEERTPALQSVIGIIIIIIIIIVNIVIAGYLHQRRPPVHYNV